MELTGKQSTSPLSCVCPGVGIWSTRVRQAQEFVDRLDAVSNYVRLLHCVGFTDPRIQALDNGGLHGQKRKQYQKSLRKLCGNFCILPSSFALAPKSIKCEAKPFASGGFSRVYKGTFEGRPVAIKTLKVDSAADREKLSKVSTPFEKRQVVTHARPGAPCQRGRWMEMASAQEHLAIHRRYINTSAHFYRFSTNGKREHHGFHQGPSGPQSSGTRESRGHPFSAIIIFLIAHRCNEWIGVPTQA
jgi:hypothetical protein